MKIRCIKECENKSIKVGEEYEVIDVDMYEYFIKLGLKEFWISKDDTEHFKYSV